MKASVPSKMKNKDRELKELFAQYLTDAEALQFCVGFILYCHAVDDLVDGDKSSAEQVIAIQELALALYTSDFYHKNRQMLFPLIKAAGNAYADSVNFERSSEDWKRAMGAAMSQVGNEVVAMCVELVSNSACRREFSLKLREISYWTHHNEKGERI